MKSEYLIDWIRKFFKSYSKHICLIGIYGSIASNKNRPNDCDLLLVTELNVDSEQWLALYSQIEEAEKIFLIEFKIPLNVAFLTFNEWVENKNFFKDFLQVNFK